MSALADGPTARPGFVPAPPASSERSSNFAPVAYTQGERPSFQRIDITGKRKRDSSRPQLRAQMGRAQVDICCSRARRRKNAWTM